MEARLKTRVGGLAADSSIGKLQAGSISAELNTLGAITRNDKMMWRGSIAATPSRVAIFPLNSNVVFADSSNRSSIAHQLSLRDYGFLNPIADLRLMQPRHLNSSVQYPPHPKLVYVAVPARITQLTTAATKQSSFIS